VPSSRFPLRINVGFLINQDIGTYRDIHFEIPTLRLDTQDDQEFLDFKGVTRVGRTTQGILAQGDFGAQITAECVRCLAEFVQPLHTEFDELFAFRTKAMTESGLLMPDDGNIDLGPIVREYLLLEVPINPLCRPDCKGLCMECGANLNEGTCEHGLPQ
jgi:uncharacterized protein